MIRTSLIRTCALLAVSVWLLLGSCASSHEADPRPVVQNTPLVLDPSMPIDLGRWWSNGSMLLELNEDARYRVYPGLNRYQSPREFGRWDRLTYASVQLQPYASEGPNPQAYRAKLEPDPESDSKGGVTLALPALTIFRPLAHVPSVVEDRIIGSWRSPQGTLVLIGDMQYRFTPSTAATSVMTLHIGHRGTWRIVRDELLLLPMASNLGPFVVKVEDSDSGEDIALISEGHALQRITEEMMRSPLTRSSE